MEEKLNNIQKIAFDYFNGNLSSEEEKTLFAFLNESKKNFYLLKKWEKEWLNSVDFSSDALNKKWTEFERRKENREKFRSIIPVRRPILQYINIVAAIAVLFTVGTVGLLWLNSTTNNPVLYYTLESPLGQKSKIKLTDGSVVWLNSGSKLTYSEAFGKKNREVNLIGEAYFEIEKSSKKFIVQTPEYKIEVKGTKFNVTAYPEEDFSSTTLLKGEVVFSYHETAFGMQPGETLQLNKNTQKVARYRNGATNSIAWMQNRIEYDKISLDDLLKRLSREYNKPILLKKDAIKDKSFSISIRNNQTLEEVLKAIGEIIPIEIKQVNNTIIII